MKFAKSKEFRGGFAAGLASPFIFANGQSISQYSEQNNLISRAWLNVGRALQRSLDTEVKRIEPAKSTDCRSVR